MACLKGKDGDACSALVGLASFWGEELRCQPRAGDAGGWGLGDPPPGDHGDTFSPGGPTTSWDSCEGGSLVGFFFDVDHFSKVLIESVTTLLLFYILVSWSRCTQDLSSPPRDRTLTLCIGRQSLNHWTAREVPSLVVLKQAHKFFDNPPDRKWGPCSLPVNLWGISVASCDF